MSLLWLKDIEGLLLIYHFAPPFGASGVCVCVHVKRYRVFVSPFVCDLDMEGRKALEQLLRIHKGEKYSIDWLVCFLINADQAPIDTSLDIITMLWAHSNRICTNYTYPSSLHTLPILSPVQRTEKIPSAETQWIWKMNIFCSRSQQDSITSTTTWTVAVAFLLLIFTMSPWTPPKFSRNCNSMCIRLDGKTVPNHQDWLSVVHTPGGLAESICSNL